MSDAPAVAPDRTHLRHRIRKRLARIDWIWLFPAVAAIAWGFGLDALVLAFAVVLPTLIALDRQRMPRRPVGLDDGYPMGAMVPRSVLQRTVEDVLADCERRERTTAVLQVQIDDLHITDGEWGAEIAQTVMDRVIQRVATAMRGQDIVVRSGDDGLTIVLNPTRRADLDVVMNIVDRIQAAVAEPISIDGRSIRVQCCIGICSAASAPARTGAALLAAADCALRLARRSGSDAVRTFTPDIQARVETDHRLATQIDEALDRGQIRPWFQPQIDTRTGALSGFEALARWDHPELGMLSPGDFLAAVGAAGRSADMGDQILRASLEALRLWDDAGIAVPCVGVNISLEELADPRLAERIIWQLDRHDIAPTRIAIEILETVTLREGDETIVHNIETLRATGFRLDLDDFGTGAASIAHIARFGVHRIKIDRSFVSGLDASADKRRIVAAILGLAHQLDIETLAEGVETTEEQAVLASLGCPHIQGYVVARPMPLSDTVTWALARPLDGNGALRGMEPRGTA
ncbi:bifunctional diguanylate cyclase/phosphodiesterase [uncultured Jannaschia sp.]|uniref:putative bifunctional diguanylate cyclase/phosphodiesterase n=1 Tax=uncultured Jannaschia sp. TaxID=293347 RepID=UPI002613BDF2|nr:GGDEF domain-containing phosphodiesterase [uncultured Jannaschia sp.]